MESEGNLYLIYDKYVNGSHAYNNIDALEYTVSSIYNENYECKINEEARYFFNSKFTQNIDEINYDFYTLNLFVIGENNYVTIFIVNINKLKSYYIENKDLPDKQLLIKAATYDKFYKNNDIDITTLIEITKEKSLIPVQNGIEISKPEMISCDLFPYQKRTVNLLNEIEKEVQLKSHIIRIIKNSDFEIKIGDLIIDPITKEIILLDDIENCLEFKGGALIDEVGLGKTLEILTLTTINKSQNTSLIVNNMLTSNATLIICPNQLCGQWKREMKKFLKNFDDLNIILLLTKVHFDNTTYHDLLTADYVITSYNFLKNPSFLNSWLPLINYTKSDINEKLSNIKEDLLKINVNLTSNMDNIFKTNPNLLLIKWHRIVIDEFHELVKNTDIYNISKLLTGNYKWCVTGTPYNNANVNNYVEFISEKKFELPLLKNTAIFNRLCNKVFIRNTKNSIEYKFPDVTQRIIWMNFTQTERMIYNAYLKDDTISKILLRQLCCHPHIVDELKTIVGNGKTLKDIEKLMVDHYKKKVENSQDVVNFYTYKTKVIERKIKVVMFKKQRKYLRELNYSVILQLPEEIPAYKSKVAIEDPEISDEEEYNSDNDKVADKKHNKEIIVSEKTQNEIIPLIDKYLKNDTKTKSIDKLKTHLKYINEKLKCANDDLNNKNRSYEFYQTVLDKLRKATNRNTDEDEDENEDESCGICLGTIGEEQISVLKCGHIFCCQCLNEYLKKYTLCPICRQRINDTDIYIIQPEIKSVKTKCIENKLELINNIGTKLANLIFYLKKIKDHVVIFSQWDDLLKKVGVILLEHGINNVFCRGNVWQRDKIIRRFNEDESIRIIMLSTDSTASGTNLTKANKVIFIDPVDGPIKYIQQTEWQAIGRIYRIGQLSSIEIVRFIIKDTVEEEIYKSYVTNKIIPINVKETLDSTIDLTTDEIRDINNHIYKKKLKKVA